MIEINAVDLFSASHGLQSRDFGIVQEEKTMKEPGLDNRHRDKNGEISRKHGNTLVRTLRKLYGAGFAPGCRDDDKLSDVLHKFDEASLSQLHRDHDGRHLEGKIKSIS